jgi:hypothetical protein
MTTVLRSRRGLRAFPVFAIAVVGVLAGHALSYALAIDDHHHRDAVLTATGHGYLSWAAKLSVALSLAAAGAVILRALDRADGGAPAEPTAARLRWLFARLSVLQTAIFAVLEVAERAFAGVPIAEVTDHLFLPLGIAMQAVVALAGAIILVLLHRAVAGLVALRRAIAPGARVAREPSRPRPADVVVTTLPAGSAGVRGPPRPA